MKYSLIKKVGITISIALSILFTVSFINTAKAASAYTLNSPQRQGILATVSNELTVKSKTIADRAKNVQLNQTIAITFSEEIRDLYDFGNIKMYRVDRTGPIEIPIEKYINKDTLTINPLYGLDYSSMYIVKIYKNSIMGVDGKMLGTDYSFYFETENEKEPPEVLYSYPSNDSRYVPINSTISIVFNEKVKQTEGSNIGVTLRDGKNDIGINCLTNDNVMIINLKNALNMAYNTTYTLTVSTGAVKDLAGNAMKESYVLKFTTEAWGTSPKLVSSNPADGTKKASVDSKITVSFDENIVKGRNFDKIYLGNEKGEKIEYTTAINYKTLTIKPKYSFDYDTTYNLVIPVEAIKGASGRVSKDKYEIKFKTDKEKFPPKVKYTYPSNGSSNVAVDSSIYIFFDEAVQKGSNIDNIMLRDSRYNYIPISYELKDDHICVQLKNNLNMSYNTTYYLTIPYKAVKDMVGNDFSTSYSCVFTTGKDRFCPIVKYIDPDNASKDIPIDSKIKVVFNDNVTKGENFDNIQLKSDDKNIDYSISINGDSIILIPSKPLENDKKYKIMIPVGAIKDLYGNTMNYEFCSDFTTIKENISPYVIKVDPAPGSLNVDTKSAITFYFSENIKIGKDFDKIAILEGSGKNILYTAELKDNTLKIIPKSQLNYGVSYNVKVPVNAVLDMSDNPLKEDAYTYFLTKGEEEKVVTPTKTSTSTKTVNNKNLLKVTKYAFNKDYSMIAVYFSENIAADKDIKNVAMKDSSNRTFGVPIGIKNNMLVIRMKAALTKGKSYTIYIPKNAIKGKSGKKMSANYTQKVVRK